MKKKIKKLLARKTTEKANQPAVMILLQQNKKRREPKEKCPARHARTIMYSEADKAFNRNAHHVPLRQSVEERRLGKE